jgi:hypothetical protein
MSTKLHDFKNQAQLGASPYPVSVNDTNNADTIDLLDADQRCFCIQMIGAVGGTSPSLTGKMQESSDGSTWTDISGATFTAVTASSSLQVITFDRTKRYVRHYRTVSGTSPTFLLGVVIGEQKKSV